MSEITIYEHITTNPEIVGGKPHIIGHRITVQNIVIWHEQMGYSVDEIATEYELTLAEIYAALAYYYDHKAAVDEDIRQSEVFIASLRAKTPSLLAKKLHERAG
jgi:uncharacterized protein (DUF433 family)